MPPVQEPYQYIIFHVSEVKDLVVDEPAQQQCRNVHDDPAVIGVHVISFSTLSIPQTTYDEVIYGC